jgi:MFS family permease
MGAVSGPLVAAALLSWVGLSLRHVFLLAAIPAVLVVVVLVAGVREAPRSPRARAASPGGLGWAGLDRNFQMLLLALVVFALGNSTDAFLLLRLTDVGFAPAQVALLWSAFHVFKMVTAYAGGRLSDTVGRKPMVLAGWCVYAAVYLGFALTTTRGAAVTLFLAYGLYFGLTEPVEKAWVSTLAPADLRGTAFGWYNGTIGLAALPASVLFGLLWHGFGASVAFAAGAGLAGMGAILLLFVTAAPTRTRGARAEVPPARQDR